MELQLVVVAEPDGEPQAFHFPDFERVTLGRGPDSPVPLDGPSLSREHIRFELRDEGLFVTDISSNGSWMNGKALGAGVARAVKPGDEVGVPGYRIRPRLISPEPDESAVEETVTESNSTTEPAPEAMSAPSDDQTASERPAPEPPPASPDSPLSTLEWIVVAVAAAVLVLIVVFFLY